MATLAAAALALVTLGGCGDDAGSDVTDTATDGTVSEGPSSETTVPAGDLLVTPFYVGQTPQGDRLFRELHRGASPADVVGFLMDGAADPDYRTLVPAGSLAEGTGLDGTGSDGAYTVELAGASWTERPAGMSAAEARLAVQQVVWTLQTVQTGDEYDPGARNDAPVDFVLDGEKVDYLGLPSGATAKPELKVLALVNVVTGFEAGPLSGDSAPVTGLASSFEATVPWQVLDADGAVVVDSFSTADGWMDRLYPWTAELDLTALGPGDFTFVAATDDPSGGEGGGPTQDTKEFTVE
ncbi:Gmad2 immunoglobulin-like domain-containing protein [Nocardioides sp. GY 10113]|uniref:Gmad2 immunoglobulin-like domain-containing protein n=1 Tax=Nocardioides sp. GY 10113 TaxID=2569761 RepID=UPI0014588892|nr:Gmad2 immunoglobulin-like domain-containing protein [Nocardioides sp. GY 10113]